MKVAIYARVSTEKQDTENQLAQLREFAAKQGWDIIREYVDCETGSKSDRAEFQQMFADASKRKFDLLLFWALDRLSREGVLETLQYLNRLTAHGVAWRSFTEQFFDSCGPFREAVIAIMATLAKQERVKRSERTRAGLELARRRGKALGQAQDAQWPARGQDCDHAAARAISAGNQPRAWYLCPLGRAAHCGINVCSNPPLSPLDFVGFLFARMRGGIEPLCRTNLYAQPNVPANVSA